MVGLWEKALKKITIIDRMIIICDQYRYYTIGCITYLAIFGLLFLGLYVPFLPTAHKHPKFDYIPAPFLVSHVWLEGVHMLHAPSHYWLLYIGLMRKINNNLMGQGLISQYVH